MSLNLKEIIKFHLLGLESLDKQSQKDLLPYLRQSELQIRNELDRFGQDTFSYAQRMQTLKILNQSIAQIEGIVSTQAVTDAQSYFDFGVKTGNKEVNTLNKQILNAPNIPEQKVSIGQNEFLINNYQASLDTWKAGLRAQISNAITQGMVARKTGFETVSRLARMIKTQRWRLQRIVRTENHRVYNAAKILTYAKFKKEDFSDLHKRLFHPMDHRTADDSKQLKQLDPIVPMDKPFVFTYRRTLKNGQVRVDKRVFWYPPDRPNDRATVLPWRKSWDKKG